MTPNPPPPETTPGVEQALAEIEALLDRADASWTRAGALAANRYRATPRFTTDADVLVDWYPALPAQLEALGMQLRILRDEGEPHLIRSRRNDEGVDLILPTTDYQRGAIQRGLRGSLTIEDVLIHKAIAWRAKDRDDIRSILSTGRAFDRAYVERWISEFGWGDRWQEAQTWV